MVDWDLDHLRSVEMADDWIAGKLTFRHDNEVDTFKVLPKERMSEIADWFRQRIQA